MATRSLIVVETKPGVYDAIYCHFDGYPEGVGATLKKSYYSEDKVDKLIEHGDVSVLRDTLEDSEFYTFLPEKRKISRNLSLDELKAKASNVWAEYIHVFRTDKKWVTEKVK